MTKKDIIKFYIDFDRYLSEINMKKEFLKRTRLDMQNITVKGIFAGEEEQR